MKDNTPDDIECERTNEMPEYVVKVKYGHREESMSFPFKAEGLEQALEVLSNYYNDLSKHLWGNVPVTLKLYRYEVMEPNFHGELVTPVRECLFEWSNRWVCDLEDSIRLTLSKVVTLRKANNIVGAF